MSNLRTYEALKVSEHHPTLVTGGGHTYAHCRCGWSSSGWPMVHLAAYSWGRHVARAVLPYAEKAFPDDEEVGSDG